MWVRVQLSELGYPQLEQTVLGEDSMSTIAMINNDCNGWKTNLDPLQPHSRTGQVTEDRATTSAYTGYNI